MNINTRFLQECVLNLQQYENSIRTSLVRNEHSTINRYDYHLNINTRFLQECVLNLQQYENSISTSLVREEVSTINRYGNVKPSDSQRPISLPSDLSEIDIRQCTKRIEEDKDLPLPSLIPSDKFQITEKPIGTERESKIQHVYYEPKAFKYFHYIYSLIDDCRSRVETATKLTVSEIPSLSDVIVKITFIQDVTDENLNIVTRKKGREDVCQGQIVWKASPLVCFQNALPLETALKSLQAKEAYHKILVKSESCRTIKDKSNQSLWMVDQDHLQEAITSCLEKPLYDLLEKWMTCLKLEPATEDTFWILSEIESIRKQMSLEEIEEKSQSESMGLGRTNIVPEEIKQYLFRKQDVSSFGIWHNAQFKVFLKENADKQILYDELKKKDDAFFKKYALRIENRTFVEKHSLRQGDTIQRKEDEKFFSGTLGGFVTEINERERKYALTCNHIFPMNDMPAYTNQCQEIGKCVFTTREKSCDFAAIEINKSASVDCDVCFRGYDNTKTNARLYKDSIDNLSIVHKVGAESALTNGSILSPEYYDNDLLDDDNRDSVFLVHGIGGHFSEQGDSGSLVFAYNRATQNYVNVVGMVYGNCNDKVKLDDEGDQRTKEDETASCESASSVDRKTGDDKFSTFYKENSALAANINPKHITFCYRVHQALELFQENQGGEFFVKFKDDLPPSP